MSDQDFATANISPDDPVKLPAIAGTGALVAAGTIWMVSQTLATKVVMLMGQLVMAYLLAKDDFGKIGLAYTVTSFISLLTNPGIDVVLVRRGRKLDLWSSPAFFFSLFTGGVGSLVILATAPFVARAYGAPELVGLLTVLAIATPLGSLSLVPTAKLRWQMRFRSLAAITLLQTTLQTIFTVALAAAGFGVYSFVLPMPLVYIITAVTSWAIARPALRFRDPLRHWRYLIGDSSYIFATSLLITAVGQGDYIVLGSLYDTDVVGTYFFAYGISLQAIRVSAGPLQSVLMSGLSRLPEFSDRQTLAALRATKALTLIGMPLCLLQAAIAGPLLQALYGEKWIAAIPIVQLISVGMAFGIATWPIGGLMQARGQFRHFFLISSCFAPVFFLSIFLGALYGQALGVAIAVCLYHIFLGPVFTYLVLRTSGIGWGEVGEIFVRPAIIGILAAGATLGISSLVYPTQIPALVQCVIAGGAGMLTVGFAARALAPASWNDIIGHLGRIFPPILPLRNGASAHRR